MKHLCFFGLGVQFHDCYTQICRITGKPPDFVCDNDPGKWDKKFYGVKCVSPAELAVHKENTQVIITVRRYEAVYKQLKETGFNNISVVCFDRCYDYPRSINPLNDDVFADNNKPFVNTVKGKWTFITGASRGVGRQIAIEMAKLGSNLILHSRAPAHTVKTADECTAFPGVLVKTIAAELSIPAETEAMLDDLVNNYPPIDIVYNNAGISLPCGSDIWNISAEDYIKHYTVNTIAPIRICYRLIPPMIKRGYGRVINVSSTIQKRPGEAAYACSKEALSKFVYDIAPSLNGTGVMISLLCPGYVRSDMGGSAAPHPVESVTPGALLGAVLQEDINGRWFIAQDYAGLDLEDAINKTWFISFYQGDALI